MEQKINKFRITSVEDVVNSDGQTIPGSYRIFCIPIDGTFGRVEAIQTFDSVSSYGTSGSKPQKNVEFIGTMISGKVYILRYVDPLPASIASQLTSTPKFKKVGTLEGEGDWGIRQNPMSFIKFLTNGYLKLQSSAETFIELVPDIVRFSKLKDKLIAKCRNFIFETFGGSIEWSNFDRDGSENYESEFKLKVHRGDPITDLQLKNNHIEVKAGSVLEDESQILNASIKFKRTDNTIDDHLLTIGQDGIFVSSTINGKKTTLKISESGITTETDGDVNIKSNGDINLKQAGNVYIGKDGGSPDRIVSESKLRTYLAMGVDSMSKPVTYLDKSTVVPTPMPTSSADLGFDDLKGGL
jgi:hypothetical protein